MTNQTAPDDLVERLERLHERHSIGGTTLLIAAARIKELTAEVERLERSLRVVQGAAKTLASAQGTELEHLRQNATYDHRLRSEHESLLERDAMMTDALEAAEARATKAEEALRVMVYETTHLSPCENDGSHWCRISGEALAKAREALGEGKA